MKRIVVHIDQLLLKGFGKEEQRRIPADLEGELGRLLADSAIADRLTLSHMTSIRVGMTNVAQNRKPVRPGISAAKAIASGLSR